MPSRRLAAPPSPEEEHEPVEDVQRPEWCVNVCGYVMEHRIKGRKKLRIARARVGLKGSWATIMAEGDVAQGNKKPYADIARPLSLSKGEKVDSIDDDHQRFLLVGITPPPSLLRGKNDPFAKSISKGGAIGTAPNPDQKHRIEWYDELPMLVGFPLPNNGSFTTQKVSLYALLAPGVDGLCTAYRVKQTHVFYFDEFRNNDTDRQRREGSWNAKVLAEASKLLNTEISAPDAAKDFMLKKGKNHNGPIFEVNASFHNEMSATIDTYLNSDKKDPRGLDDLERLMAEVEDPEETCPTNVALRKFLDVREEFDDDDAIDFIKEISRQWSSTFEGKLSTSFVIRLREDLVLSEINVEYRLLRGYVIEAMRMKKAGKFKRKSRSYIGQECLDAARDHAPEMRSQPRGLVGSEGAKLENVLIMLEQGLEAYKDYTIATRDESGEKWSRHSLDDVYETYATACDADSARLALEGIGRIQTMAVQRGNQGLMLYLQHVINTAK